MSKIDVLLLANFILIAPHLKHGMVNAIAFGNIAVMAYLTWWA